VCLRRCSVRGGWGGGELLDMNQVHVASNSESICE
jgi:hypothetical protein